MVTCIAIQIDRDLDRYPIQSSIFDKAVSRIVSDVRKNHVDSFRTFFPQDCTVRIRIDSAIK